MASRHERLMRVAERQMALGVDNGIARLSIEDSQLEDPFITIDGRKLIDFGSCSYLALNRDQRLIDASKDAVQRFGTGHSSSTMYTSLSLYETLGDLFKEQLGVEVAIAPTTTLAHLAALPVLLGPGDLALVDQQAHASLRLAATVLAGNGVDVKTVDHNDVAALGNRLETDCKKYNHVWYIADGLYSMHGDLAPTTEVRALLDKFSNLFLYFDDAHAYGWQGRNGVGHTVSSIGWHERLVVAFGLAKSFGTTGGVLAFGDPALARRVVLCGAPFTFSGPLQPADLGASIASAHIHLSNEHKGLQAELLRKINLARTLLVDHGLPVVDLSPTPIWFIRLGRPDAIIKAVRGLMDDGFYTNPANFPAVPVGEGGIRFTQTLHQSDDDLRALVTAMAKRVVSTGLDLTIDLRDPDRAQVTTTAIPAT